LISAQANPIIITQFFGPLGVSVYRPGKILNTLALEFVNAGGLADDEVSREELAALCDQTRSGFRMQMFPGDHFYLNGKESNIVLEVISRDISRITSKTNLAGWEF
jgi:surfactin synthase thioesterase subunit